MIPLSDSASPVEVYHYFLFASAGTTNIDLSFFDDQTSTISFHVKAMGMGNHLYLLKGKHIPISVAHGWLSIETMHHQNLETETSEVFELEPIFGFQFIYEYFKVERSPYHEHPDDLQQTAYLVLNQTFDLILILHRVNYEIVMEIKNDNYRYARWNDDLGDMEAVSIPKWVVDALLGIEKTRYARDET